MRSKMELKDSEISLGRLAQRGNFARQFAAAERTDEQSDRRKWAQSLSNRDFIENPTLGKAVMRPESESKSGVTNFYVLCCVFQFSCHFYGSVVKRLWVLLVEKE